MYNHVDAITDDNSLPIKNDIKPIYGLLCPQFPFAFINIIKLNANIMIDIKSWPKYAIACGFVRIQKLSHTSFYYYL